MRAEASGSRMCDPPASGGLMDGAQLHQTALTTIAKTETLAARMPPQIDWNKLLGVSCSASLGGALGERRVTDSGEVVGGARGPAVGGP